MNMYSVHTRDKLYNIFSCVHVIRLEKYVIGILPHNGAEELLAWAEIDT